RGPPHRQRPVPARPGLPALDHRPSSVTTTFSTAFSLASSRFASATRTGGGRCVGAPPPWLGMDGERSCVRVILPGDDGTDASWDGERSSVELTLPISAASPPRGPCHAPRSATAPAPTASSSIPSRPGRPLIEVTLSRLHRLPSASSTRSRLFIDRTNTILISMPVLAQRE